MAWGTRGARGWYSKDKRGCRHGHLAFMLLLCGAGAGRQVGFLSLFFSPLRDTRHRQYAHALSPCPDGRGLGGDPRLRKREVERNGLPLPCKTRREVDGIGRNGFSNLVLVRPRFEED